MRRRKGTQSTNGISRKSSSDSVLSKINRLLGRRIPSKDYGRELEDGSTRLYDPNDFELGAMDSSDEEGEGKLASGYASPTAKRIARSGGQIGRLTPDLMDRNGMLLRTESREK